MNAEEERIQDITDLLKLPRSVCTVNCSNDDILGKHSKLFDTLRNNRYRTDRDTITFSVSLVDGILCCTPEDIEEEPYQILNCSYGDAVNYNFIVDLAINSPEKVKFSGSLGVRDFAKIFEICARSQRRFLDDEQFNAIYLGFLKEKEMLPQDACAWFSRSPYIIKPINIQESMNNELTRLTIKEKELLESQGLFGRQRTRDQMINVKALPKTKIYFLKENLDYMFDFIHAWLVEDAERIDFALIRDRFKEIPKLGGARFFDSFKKIFDKNQKNDLSLEF